MDTEKQIAELTVKLAESAVKNTAATITTKISTLKDKKDDKRTIQFLEDTVNDLLADKTEVIRIAQAYEQELVSQQISEQDIEYIAGTVVPLIEKFIEKTEDEAEREKMKEYVDILRSILSKETITVMQLLGFNFKRALGEPLTLLLQRMILSKSPHNDKELQKLQTENSNLTLKVAENQEATERFLRLIGKP